MQTKTKKQTKWTEKNKGTKLFYMDLSSKHLTILLNILIEKTDQSRHSRVFGLLIIYYCSEITFR